MKSNFIGHCQEGPNSGKVYIVSVRKVTRNYVCGWELGIKHGLRANFPQVQRQLFETEEDARREQRALIDGKLIAEGYDDIDHSDYDGNVTRGDLERRWLVFEYDKDGREVPLDDVDWGDPVPPNDSGDDQDDDVVVICIDNIGLEDNFDVGVEYLADGADGKVLVDDKYFLKVRDKFDEMQECLAERFKFAPNKL